MLNFLVTDADKYVRDSKKNERELMILASILGTFGAYRAIGAAAAAAAGRPVVLKGSG
jgi:hypothetical protein